jgi:ribosomal protein L40E
MPVATCRCGQSLSIPADGTERIVCPKCGARVRVRLGGLRETPNDGFIRFFCQCGRRLKVNGVDPPTHGKCPDCGRVVPVPDPKAPPQTLPPGHPESPTEDLSALDAAMLDEWSRKHLGETDEPHAPASTAIQTTKPTGRVEAGLRVCPKCGKPVHLGASVCRACGSKVPKR